MMSFVKSAEDQLNSLTDESPNPTPELRDLLARSKASDNAKGLYTGPFNLAAGCCTGYATLHMAGDYNHAKALSRKFVMRGACVQLSPCEYIYTGGVEEGFTARIIRYPRFPKTLDELTKEAVGLGNFLAEELGQVSFSVETSETTYYFTHPTFKKK